MPLNRDSNQSMDAIKTAHAQLRQSARTLEEHGAFEMANWMTASADKLLPILDPDAVVQKKSQTSGVAPPTPPRKKQSPQIQAPPPPDAAPENPDPETLVV